MAATQSGCYVSREHTWYFTSDGVNYYNAETTAPGTYIGEAGNFPSQENGLESSGYVFPLP